MMQLLALCVVSLAAARAEQLNVPIDHSVTSLVASASSVGSDPFCFVSFGCWGGHNLATQGTVVKLMEEVVEKLAPSPVKFVIAAGDNFYKRGVTGVHDKRFRKTFEDVYRSPTLDKVPFLVALGNHDYRGDFFAQVNYTYLQFSMEGGKQRGTGRWYLPHPYYSIMVAHDMVVVVLDGPLFERCKNNGNDSPRCWDGGFQRQWLERELLETYKDVRYKVVVCHYPLHANGPHINFPWLVEWIQPLMEKADVALYINADNHYLQVSHIEPVYYVNSGGGAGIGVRHTPHNRGYKRSPHDIFTDISDGVFLHCITASRDQLVTDAFRTDRKKLFTFTSAKKKPAGAIHSVSLNTTAAAERKLLATDNFPSQLEPDLTKDEARSKSGDDVRRLHEAIYAANNRTYAMVMCALVLILAGCFVAHRRSGGRSVRRK